MAKRMWKADRILQWRGGSMHLPDNGVGIVSEAIVAGGIPLAIRYGLTAQLRRPAKPS